MAEPIIRVSDLPKISINGRFLSQPLTGVQRFARELTQALDKRIGEANLPAGLRNAQWRLVVPKGTNFDIDLANIPVESFGGGPGHVWEQTALAFHTRGDLLVGFGNSGPLLHPRQLVVIHDTTIFRNPESFSNAYRLFHAILGFVLTRTARIATVSKFSRQELGDIFRVPESGIDVVYNGADHFAGIVPDEAIMEKLALAGRDFFLLVGTLKPNKNVPFAIRAFDALGRSDQKLVIVGGTDPKVFKTSDYGNQRNMIFPGRLTDAEIAALERHATAFIFPSLYEGFGIPPLEAMMQGCPVLAADIASVREACGDGAVYFDPTRLEDLQQAMLSVIDDAGLRARMTKAGAENAGRFSWTRSADDLLAILAEMEPRKPYRP